MTITAYRSIWNCRGARLCAQSVAIAIAIESMNKKVVVAMSGGVDSSVAAALLKEQGYDVYGITMKLSNWESTEGRTFGGCCGSKDFYDARSVAQTLGILHYQFDYVPRPFQGHGHRLFQEELPRRRDAQPLHRLQPARPSSTAC